jgi:hypothetical protein
MPDRTIAAALDHCWNRADSLHLSGALLVSLLVVSQLPEKPTGRALVASQVPRVISPRERSGLAISLEEVCLVQLLNLHVNISGYGYKNRYIKVTNNGSSGCGGDDRYNVVFSLAAEMCGSAPCGVAANYPASYQDPSTPNENRGYACIRANFGYSWVACATHLSVDQGHALFQSGYYKNVLAAENNLRVKLAAGDFNMRPRSHGAGTYGLPHFYESYREADNYYYDLYVNNTTRNPPAIYPNQKIDYVFAGASDLRGK